jgi:DNA-binding NarL/FixJ family response regulator
VRVVIGEDAGLYRDMLRLTLVDGGHEVVGEARTTEELVTVVQHSPPDVVLLDIRMPSIAADDGIRAAVRVRQQHPDVAVLLLSNHGEAECAARLVRQLGDRVGYLHKDRTDSARELLDAIDRVAGGGVIIDPEVVVELIRQPWIDSPLGQLSARELEALALMAKGHGNAAIARQMNISVSTVEKHVSAVFRKLATDSEAEVVVAADNARVHAVLTFLRHTGRLRLPPGVNAGTRCGSVPRARPAP